MVKLLPPDAQMLFPKLATVTVVIVVRASSAVFTLAAAAL